MSPMYERSLVCAAQLGRTYSTADQRVHAVRDATFSIDRAATITLVGPSGSGKSTLLHLIAGIDEPTAGSISWPAIGDRASLRPGPIGLAFQGPSLLPPLTVLENVALPMILAGHSEREANIASLELLAVFDVSALADRLPEELSGGQAQRAGLARAFSGAPRLVLADEPTGQQDRENADRVMDAILTVADQDATAVVIATHDPDVASRLEARWTMHDGALTAGAVAWSA
jgi:ABC-type lipoprotein export system ATPase subunit